MAVQVRTEGGFSAGTPGPLFKHSGFGRWYDPNYDVSPNGERFLIPTITGESSKEGVIRVVQNWYAEFRR